MILTVVEKKNTQCSVSLHNKLIHTQGFLSCTVTKRTFYTKIYPHRKITTSLDTTNL